MRHGYTGTGQADRPQTPSTLRGRGQHFPAGSSARRRESSTLRRDVRRPRNSVFDARPTHHPRARLLRGRRGPRAGRHRLSRRVPDRDCRASSRKSNEPLSVRPPKCSRVWIVSASARFPPTVRDSTARELAIGVHQMPSGALFIWPPAYARSFFSFFFFFAKPSKPRGRTARSSRDRPRDGASRSGA